jgi:phosphoenolpyruvate-protein phosphotransferase (PTS system enzyme I)
MKEYQGVGISAGIAIGPIFLYDVEKIIVEPDHVSEPEIEEKRFNLAIKKAEEELQDVLASARNQANSADAEIFDAQIMILMDPILHERVHNSIREDHHSADYAWYEATRHYAELIGSLENEYIAARSADIGDIEQRVLRRLKGVSVTASRDLEIPSIIVAEELSPSDTISFDKTKVLAFCTVGGGPTSHVAILSKALGIPAIVGIGPWKSELQEGTLVVVDGFTGKMIIEPDKISLNKFKEYSLLYQDSYKKAFEKTHEPAITKDGVRVEVVANIGNIEDAKFAVEYGAEGVGLLRTEFIFLDRVTPPDEDEQVSIYKNIFKVFGHHPVVARTLDIGGDKPAEYLKIPPEMNPFLGLRGTRLALARPEIFRTQLRSLFRASSGCNIKIMFPMIGTIQEVREVKQHIANVRGELLDEGCGDAEKVEIGIMIEIPSAAVMADILAKEVDFFSIGTNDLSQYTLAADRGNSNVATIANALDPAVLRLIHMVVKAAHENNKWVGLCGELAGDSLATPVLLGIGIDEFSMNPRSIPLVKQSIRRFSMSSAREIANHVLQLSSAEDVRYYLKSFL